MKALILAAGFGSRLMPLTANVPKTMVEYKGKKLIEYEIEALKGAGIDEIAVVGGYKFEVLREFLECRFDIDRFFENKNYANTNMLYSLFCAREFLFECIAQKQDIVISYADIVYFQECVESLIAKKGDLVICVDMQWQNLWKARFTDILSDAETLKMQKDSSGEFFITELGKKPQNLADIQAQYMGFFKISHQFLDKVIKSYDTLDINTIFDGQPYNNIYMTSFLQYLIDKYHNAKAVQVWGNWCEIDFKDDLNIDIDLLKNKEKESEIFAKAVRKGAIIWICGLAGSGKSTLAAALIKRLREKFDNIVYLDGDELREIFEYFSYDRNGRIQMALKRAKMARFLSKQGQIVIVSTISLFSEIYVFNRTNLDNYFEVFVDCEFDELISRDQKGLYTKAKKGEIKNVVGVDIKYDTPNPNLILKNSKAKELDKNVEILLDEFLGFYKNIE